MPKQKFSGPLDRASDLAEPKALRKNENTNKVWIRREFLITNLAKQKRQAIRLQEQKIDNPKCTVPALAFPVEGNNAT